MTREHETFWAGDFGDQYLQRNQVRWQDRIPFWQRILSLTKAKSALEVGCNVGWNMLALRAADPTIYPLGIDINTKAIDGASQAGLLAMAMPATEPGKVWKEGGFDIVFTAGVLIHIPPEELQEVMRSNITASIRHVLAIEYADDTATEITYRGHANRLWKRPYGDIYESLGLNLVAAGDAGPGFDHCHYWLMEKT